MEGVTKEDSGSAEALDLTPSKAYSVEAACAMVYYAAERTLMSVVLMALGLMGLGFVIDRFGLLLLKAPQVQGIAFHPITFWTGSVLVLTGSFVLFVAILRYIGLERRFQRERCGLTGHGLSLGMCITLFVASSGVAISVLLMTVR